MTKNKFQVMSRDGETTVDSTFDEVDKFVGLGYLEYGSSHFIGPGYLHIYRPVGFKESFSHALKTSSK